MHPVCAKGRQGVVPGVVVGRREPPGAVVLVLLQVLQEGHCRRRAVLQLKPVIVCMYVCMYVCMCRSVRACL
jgi:hypothetical protein